MVAQPLGRPVVGSDGGNLHSGVGLFMAQHLGEHPRCLRRPQQCSWVGLDQARAGRPGGEGPGGGSSPGDARARGAATGLFGEPPAENADVELVQAGDPASRRMREQRQDVAGVGPPRVLGPVEADVLIECCEGCVQSVGKSGRRHIADPRGSPHPAHGSSVDGRGSRIKHRLRIKHCPRASPARPPPRQSWRAPTPPGSAAWRRRRAERSPRQRRARTRAAAHGWGGLPRA